MKNQYIVYMFMVSSLMFTFSCTEEIELTPDSVITVNSFWKTEQDARGGLYGMYNQFRAHAANDHYLFGGARSEEMDGKGIQNPDWRRNYFGNTLTVNTLHQDWQQTYRVINFANLIIRNVPDIEFSDESDKNDMIAQAYAMRAYIYFLMAKTWGDLPLVTDPVEGYDPETTFKERTPVDEIFDLIKSDIDQALALFPNNQFPEGRSIWSKPAVNTLKGNVYLWTGKRMGGGTADITTALNALEEAENADVLLLDNFSDIFDYNNKGNQEIIFAAHFRDLEAGNNYFSTMYLQVTDYPNNIDEETKERLGTGGGFNWWAPTALVRNQFNDDDQRRDATFLEIYTLEDDDPSYLTSVVLKGNGFVEAGERRFVDDIIIYRYADLLLLKAEAKNALEQDPSPEINTVRKRAYGDTFPAHEFINGSKEENDEAILQERLFELAFEGKRWWDLVRFGKAFEKVPSLQGRAGQDHLLLFPIPQETMTLNSKIQQNPGY